MGFYRLEIRCSQDNEKSSQVARRNNYLLEGNLIGQCFEFNAFRNTLIYAKTLPEFSNLLGRAFIRRANQNDIAEIHSAHMRSIQEVCAQDYSVEQINAWGKRKLNAEKWPKRILNDEVWVVDLAGHVEGIGHACKVLQTQSETQIEINALYLTPAVLGKGLGQSIINKFKDWAQTQKIAKLSLNSTKTSLGFYQKMGFVKKQCESVPFMINNVAIDCYPMEAKTYPSL